MRQFASLLEALLYEPARNGKLALLVDYLRQAPHPERGYALAVMTQSLVLDNVKPALLRALIQARVDATLFQLSYDFVGDLSETIALLWPSQEATSGALDVGEVVERMRTMGKVEAMRVLPQWLDALDTRERWALLKLVTGSLRVGVSTGLAKQALAMWSGIEQSRIEEVWHAVQPPYTALFAWLEGREPKPDVHDAAVFFSPMLAQPIDRAALDALEPARFAAEWKWDGIRAQIRARDTAAGRQATIFSRSGDDITASFPDLLARFPLLGTFDGELVATDRENPGAAGDHASFSALQQRLNRKTISAAVLERYPARFIAYDLLFGAAAGGEVEDLRALAYHARRARLALAIQPLDDPRFALSEPLPFTGWDELARLREDSASRTGIEGVMLKRLEGPYLPGRPQGEWFKWKRDAHLLDCVMMYAQRGHGKRASLYSDFTFGLWQEGKLLPVGKAYFGFTDAELAELDRFVRHHTVNRFGPVREVVHEPDKGLVLEIAFEGVQRSTRHKSGFAMRFPRIHRIRHDKPPAEADQLQQLEALVT